VQCSSAAQRAAGAERARPPPCARHAFPRLGAPRRYCAPQWARDGIEVVLIDTEVVHAHAEPLLLTRAAFYAEGFRAEEGRLRKSGPGAVLGTGATGGPGSAPDAGAADELADAAADTDAADCEQQSALS